MQELNAVRAAQEQERAAQLVGHDGGADGTPPS